MDLRESAEDWDDKERLIEEVAGAETWVVVVATDMIILFLEFGVSAECWCFCLFYLRCLSRLILVVG